MKRYQLTLLMIVMFVQAGLMAQEDVKIVKKEFNIEKEGFWEAWGHIKTGDENYNLGGGLYPVALGHFLKALEYNHENPELNYKTGVSCLFGDSPQDALDYLLAAREADPNVSQDLMLLTGLAYHSKGDYGMALDCYNNYSDMFIESNKFNPIVNRYIKECNRAIELSAVKQEVEILNLGEAVNSEADDYAPVVTKENSLLYFTSRRNVQMKSERNRADMKFDENIFISTKTNSEWNNAGIAGKSVATELNEGVLYVDSENETMYIYAGWSGNGDIFVSDFKKGKWSDPVALGGGVNSPSRETSFTISSDTDERFFTSDRKKGGNGGRDIWYTRRVAKEKWTKPKNLGSDVNSPGNEESVWVSSTGDTLWFSSNGRDGMGGYDVYITHKDETGSWSEPENLGIPVNSQWDDLFYRPLGGADDRAHLSSNRPGGRGGFDIYKVKYPVYTDTIPALPVQILEVLTDSITPVYNNPMDLIESDTLNFLSPPDSLHIVTPDTIPMIRY